MSKLNFVIMNMNKQKLLYWVQKILIFYWKHVCSIQNYWVILHSHYVESCSRVASEFETNMHLLHDITYMIRGIVMFVAATLPFNWEGWKFNKNKLSYIPLLRHRFLTANKITAKNVVSLLSHDNIEDNLKRWVFAQLSGTMKCPCIACLYMRMFTRLHYSLVELICKQKYVLMIFPCQTSMYLHVSCVSCCINSLLIQTTNNFIWAQIFQRTIKWWDAL